MKRIENSCVLIVGSGESLKTYFKPIKNFIKKENATIFGCNHVSHILIPHYHFWMDRNRYKSLGNFIYKNSCPVFSSFFSKKQIREHWKKEYIIVKYKNYYRKIKRSVTNFDDDKHMHLIKFKYHNGVFMGYIKTTGIMAIFYAHVNEASTINIVGMDGYTFHSEKELNGGKVSQHCYGKGHTDYIYNKENINKYQKKYEKGYENYQKKDKQIYNILKQLKKQVGINFKILTPTVYSEFYDSSILGI
jgi:hypothetical protein